ncbi:MAG: hypothetical protein P4M15_09485 [Alphaproteobacteria bacterium]|nr:hypothetical protein [Alphaproteobacteria bacterium]
MFKSENLPVEATDMVPVISGGVVRLGDGAYEIAGYVTRRVLSQRDNIPVYVVFETAAADSAVQAAPAGRGSEAKMGAARVADVINLETGEPAVLIMNKVLESELERFTGGTIDDPNGGYVGRAFAIKSEKDTKDADGRDRRYRVYTIFELRKKGDGAPVKVSEAGKALVDHAKKRA